MNQELQAIYFLWKRELIRFFRSKSRIVGSLAMPFFFLIMLGFGIGGMVNMGTGGPDYMDYIAPGILGMVLLFASIFSGVIVLMDKQFGFLKETLVAPVSRISIVLGKALGGATTAVLQGILMLFLMILMGINIPLESVPALIVIMFLISIAFVSLGIAMASVMEDMHGFQLIMNFLIFPLFFLSGALFPLDGLPPIIKFISYLDPLTYGVDALRLTLLGTSQFHIAIDMGVLVGFLILTTVVAAYLFRRIES